jgi:hypothetical protein
VGASLASSIISGGNLRSGGRPPLMAAPVGVVALVGGVMGASWIG